MNNLQIVINNKPITAKTYQQQRVVTFKDIDLCHGRPEGTARKRFNNNQKRLSEGLDYFVLQTDEAARRFGIAAPNGLKLLTESGYLMIVKTMDDDLAWTVQRDLVNKYFRVQNQAIRIEQLETEAKAARARAMEMNAKTRALQTLMKTTDNKNLSHIALEVYGLKAMGTVTGKDFGDRLPQIEKTYSATEVGKIFGVSANKVGSIANRNGLKTDDYGISVLDKSPYSAKEITAFRYNQRGVDTIGRLLDCP